MFLKYHVLTALTGAFLTLLLGRLASAQDEVDANEIDATGGVLLPSPSVTETRDATALAVNPGNLGFIESWDLFYVGSWLKDQQRLAGQGHGFFLGLPLGPIGFGVGVEPLFPGEEIVSWQGLGQRTRFSIGLGLSLKRIIGIGIAYRTFWFERFDGPHSLDLGLTIHPLNHLAFSFVFADLNAPKFKYLRPRDEAGGETMVEWADTTPYQHRAPRQFIVGLTIRPLGTDRLALGGELKYLHGDVDNRIHDYSGTYSRTDITALLAGIPVKGISLRMRFIAEGVRSGRDPNLILDGAISLDLPNIGLGASMHGQVAPESLQGYQGTTWFAHVHGAVGHSLTLPRPLRAMHLVVLDIEDSLDSYGLTSLSSTFERIERDKSVDMILLRPDPGTVSLSDAQEIRERIRRFQKTGRKVACYMTEATSAVYYACAGADYVWLNPAGGIRLAGLRMQFMYFKDLLDKVGVKADIIRIGEYKSAPETYTRNGPSDHSVEQVEFYLDSVYHHLLESLNNDRGVGGLAAVRKVIEGGPFTANEALEKGLVDTLIGGDELENKIHELAGGHVFIDTEYRNSRVMRDHYIDAPAVAVVHITGDLVDGESVSIPFLDVKMTGAKTMTETLRGIAADSRIRAVLLRIDSPGGSSLASDIIWREVMALRAEKPVIASMGSVAASGAYYIASAANEIYADPTTLTGSIGIYYGKADLSGLLDMIGVDVATFKRGTNADTQSWTRAYTDEERKKMKSQLNQYYQLFLSRVAKGRGRGFTTKTADKLGRGRIWSGKDAKQHHLVDELGGYGDALERTREYAGIPGNIPVFHYPKKPSNIFVKMLTSAVTLVRGREESPMQTFLKTTGMKRILTPAVPFAVQNPEHPQARLPYVPYMD